MQHNDKRARSRRQNNSLTDLIKDNPLPSALIGLGVGLLAAGSATAAGSAVSSDDTQEGDENTRYISGYSVPVSQSPDYIGARSLPKPGQTTATEPMNHDQSKRSRTHQGRSQSAAPTSGLARWVEDYPLAVGAVTALIGAAIGLSMPGSRLEDELMGETSDTLIHEAKSTVTDAVDVVKETATQAVSTAKDEFLERTASPEEIREEVKSSVKSAASTVADEVKDGAKNVVEMAKETAKTEADKRGLKSEAS